MSLEKPSKKTRQEYPGNKPDSKEKSAAERVAKIRLENELMLDQLGSLADQTLATAGSVIYNSTFGAFGRLKEDVLQNKKRPDVLGLKESADKLIDLIRNVLTTSGGLLSWGIRRVTDI